MARLDGMEVMHQYELMRLLERVAAMLADVADGLPCTSRARDLSREISAHAAEWQDEERQYVEAVTRHADDVERGFYSLPD